MVVAHPIYSPTLLILTLSLAACSCRLWRKASKKRRTARCTTRAACCFRRYCRLAFVWKKTGTES